MRIRSKVKKLLIKFHIEKHEFYMILLLNLFYFLLLLLCTFLFVDTMIIILSIIEVLLLLFLHNYSIILQKRKNSYAKQNQINDYNQIESYINLVSVINITRPLPKMRGAAIAPDFANILVSIMLENKPEVILECGSGVSTLIISYCIKKLGSGHIWSLDHEKKYLDITRKNVQIHGLENYASVIFAPLKSIVIDNKNYNWYETKSLKTIPSKIDLLVIDGPPRRYSSDVRYPALPLLYDYLSDDAVIVLDDANRQGEKEIINKWLELYNIFTYELNDTEKGTVILRKL